VSILTKSSFAMDPAFGVWPEVRLSVAGATTVFVVSAVYYGLCLYPGLGGELNAGDSAKFQILGHTPIMVHGPGYPFVLLLGEVVRALALPLPPWWTMTFALSALPAAVANAVAFLIVHRLTSNFVLALAGALLLGSAHLMSIQATEAEVYALNIAFLLTTLYLLLLFSQTRRPGFFVAACAVYAISFGDHLMMIMLVPLFVWMTVLHRRIVLRPGTMIAVFIFILLGASQYLFLAYVAHDPRTSYSEYMLLPPTAAELMEYISGMYFKNLFGSGFYSTKNILELLKTFRSAHPWVSAPLIGVGLALFLYGWNLKDDTWRGIALLLGGATCFLPFVLGYGPFDIQAFHLPVLAPVLLAAVASLGWSLRRRPALLSVVAAFLLAVGVVRAAQTAIDLRDREPQFAGLKSAIEDLVAKSPVPEPFVAMGYSLRMAELYYEVRGDLPKVAAYRLIWRMPEQISDQPLIGGIVMPPDEYQMIGRIAEKRPDLICHVKEIPQQGQRKWPAYSFLCRTRPAA
jgi:hypothetical protein